MGICQTSEDSAYGEDMVHVQENGERLVMSGENGERLVMSGEKVMDDEPNTLDPEEFDNHGRDDDDDDEGKEEDKTGKKEGGIVSEEKGGNKKKTPIIAAAAAPQKLHKIIEDERVSQFDYEPYEVEDLHVQRSQHVLGLKMIHTKFNTATRARHPALPQHPDYIDKVFGEYDYWSKLPPQEQLLCRSVRPSTCSWFCRFIHARLHLPRLDEKTRAAGLAAKDNAPRRAPPPRATSGETS
ncbi:hypothetical protein ACEQ8H_003666 [Pleosporales sp. CAS-2024a]